MFTFSFIYIFKIKLFGKLDFSNSQTNQGILKDNSVNGKFGVTINGLGGHKNLGHW